MIKKTKKIVEELQKLEEYKKKYWFWGLNIISTAIVVSLWLIYFNWWTMPMTQQAQKAPEEKNQVSFLQTMKKGTAVIYENLKRKTLSEKSFEIKKDFDFQTDDLPEIKITKLPIK